MTTITWNPDTSLLEGPAGIIPLPHDWAPQVGGSLAMDFVYYLGKHLGPCDQEPGKGIAGLPEDWAGSRSYTLRHAFVGGADSTHYSLRR